MATEKRLIDVNDVYKLFDKNGMARIHVADIDLIPRVDAVEVPCRIGDPVWCIQNNFGRPIAKQGVVSEICFGEDMRLGVRVKGLCGGEWGQRVFATREEAETAIKERRSDG